MFNRKTVVVVGAGASSEFGLPTGGALKTEIASLLDIRFADGHSQSSGDHDICEAYRHAIQLEDARTRDINPLRTAGIQIRDAMPLAISIDNYLDVHKGNHQIELCGKLAISRAILKAEQHSSLYVHRDRNEQLDFEKNQKTWINSFFQLLTENCPKEELAERLEGISLIIFNYDRCVEHYLYNALQNYYQIRPEEAAKLIRIISIYHPYGKVGDLPFLDGQASVDFGAHPSPNRLLGISSQLRTFTEGTDPDESDIEGIRSNIVKANIIMFLGFAYHRLNLDLLKPKGDQHCDKFNANYFGTAFELSDSDSKIIRHDLSELAGAQPDCIKIRNDLRCAGLFSEYWRSLSLS